MTVTSKKRRARLPQDRRGRLCPMDGTFPYRGVYRGDAGIEFSTIVESSPAGFSTMVEFSPDRRIHQGTQRDAILFACGANAAHGLRRTNADKRRAVEALLNDPEWVTWSDGRIAEKAAVGVDLVGSVRRQLSESDNSPAAVAADKPRVGKDGKSYPAKKPQASKTNTAPEPREPGDDPQEPAHDDSVHDEYGPVAPRFRAVFSLVSEFRGLVQKIGKRFDPFEPAGTGNRCQLEES